MANGHKNLKRLFHRVIEELNSTKRIAKVVGWKNAFLTLRAKFDIQIMNHNSYIETPNIKKRLLKKHEIMMHYIDKEFSEFIDDYDFNDVKLEKNDKKLNNIIWVCWWQGLDNAPEIVKTCINSIINNSGKYKVIVLTDENYRQYVNMPDWIEEKRKNGIISRTHYSDFLRMEILAEHGGIWLDSTFYCKNVDFDKYFDLPVWTIKRPDYGHASVACGNFANYSLGCNSKNRRVFAVIRDFLAYYWQNNDEIIDYLLTDYLIVLVQKYDKNIKKLFDNIPSNNPKCDELFKILSDEYNDCVWNDLITNTSLFKLTWKQNFSKEINGKKTFYGKIIDKEL